MKLCDDVSKHQEKTDCEAQQFKHFSPSVACFDIQSTMSQHLSCKLSRSFLMESWYICVTIFLSHT